MVFFGTFSGEATLLFSFLAPIPWGFFSLGADPILEPYFPPGKPTGSYENCLPSPLKTWWKKIEVYHIPKVFE